MSALSSALPSLVYCHVRHFCKHALPPPPLIICQCANFSVSSASTGANNSANGSGAKRISRVLIANRGEIALRVMRTAKQMGIKTIAVYSDADTKSKHTQQADEAYRIGEASALRSYLCADRIIEAALSAKADAIHPGYGFLSENANFAEQCSSNGIIFMGPPPEAIRSMGMKNTAKQIMIEANVPVVPGYNGSEQSDQHLFEQAVNIGFPIMMKAVCGGGGKGMRIAWNEQQFRECLESARSESQKAFGNSDMILERYVQRPRHVEVQIFGDHHDNYVYLWERDCSIQRRHQKIIEEAPAPGLSQETRHWLGKTAVDASRAVGYVGAGTVEFIMDPADGQFYFMEMNTRLQVEHPITEAITGLDLVQWQFQVAQGEELPLNQSQITLNGHAVETRIYAEDSEAGFMPTAGKLEHLEFPPDVRVDSGVREGDEVSVHYDPMIAKVVAHGANRAQAIARLDSALQRTHIAGLCNNVRFVRACLQHARFRQGDVYTDFIAEHLEELLKPPIAGEQALNSLVEAAVGQLLMLRFFSIGTSPFSAEPGFFRLNHFARRTLKLGDDQSAEVEIRRNGLFKIKFPHLADNKEYDVMLSDVQYGQTVETKRPLVHFTLELKETQKRWNCKAVLLEKEMMVYGPNDEHKWPSPVHTQLEGGEPSSDPASLAGIDGKARSPMPGLVEKVFVQPGDRVQKDQPLVAMSSMKMEYIIRAPFDGIVLAVSCTIGANVAKDTLLVQLQCDESKNGKASTEDKAEIANNS